MRIKIRSNRRSLVTMATMFSGADDAEFVVPEDLTTLSAEELVELHAAAVGHFDAAYGDGTGLTGDILETLAALTSGIEAMAAELSARDTATLATETAAADLAARVRSTLAVGDELEDGSVVVAEGDTLEELAEQLEDVEEGAEPAEDEATEDDSLVASGTGAKRPVTIRLPQGGSRARAAAAGTRQALATKGRDMRSVVFAKGEDLGVEVGSGMNFDEMGRALDKRLSTANVTRFQNAHKMNRPIREIGSFAAIQRPISDDLVIKGNDRDHVERVLSLAASEKNLPGKSLVASGGWHAPSEVLYEEFLELESRDGILSLPEVGIARGGVQITPGTSFAEIYAAIDGFHFTEEDDIAGDYALDSSGDPTAGSKPVYHVEAPEFEEYRLDVDGLIIQSGLLNARGYPEHLARIIRGALVAHDHRINASVITALETGSTGITMTAGQVGTLAPVLKSIELQTEHYRDMYRMPRGSTLEAVFPFWIRGAIRTDLSLRMGVDMNDVPDSRIDAWFRTRGIQPQFVYDWQSLSVTAMGSLTAWPTSVKFLLYAAGTWIKGISDILTLDTIYDSTLLGQNDFTALFTEEGWFAAKRGFDSRVVTTSISSTGALNIGVEIANSGAEAA